MRGPLTRARLTLLVVVSSVVLLLSLIVGLVFGAEAVSPAEALDGPGQARTILLELRLPRVLVAALVGAALALAGAGFQALLRNPLASPYVLGISGGGALGAVAALLLGLDVVLLGISTRPLFAFGGCLAALALLGLVAGRRRIRPHTLLLAGVVVNALFAALIAMITYVVDPHHAIRIVRWLMGGIHLTTGPERLGALLVLALGAGMLLLEARALNLLSLGEEGARQLGVDVNRTRRRVFVAASLLTAAAVAVAGPVGFVGLVVPHAVRMILGPDHRALLPVALVSGGTFLVLADTVARVVRRPEELPVGIVTAFVGAPFFLWLLAGTRRTFFEEPWS
jgi:iron complex transport system permease protein